MASVSVDGAEAAYELLEKKIQALPRQGFEELLHYVDYLFLIYQNTSEKKSYSESLRNFRAVHDDFLSDAAATEGLDDVFEDIRDRGEQLKGTDEPLW